MLFDLHNLALAMAQVNHLRLNDRLWNFDRNIYTNRKTREYILLNFTPISHPGDERIIIYRERISDWS